MLINHIELSRDGSPKALITWHLPRPDGLYHAIAFQFAEDVDEETRSKILEVSKRPIKVPQKQYKPAQCGSPDHFGMLAQTLSRLGFRTRTFGGAQHEHALSDRPIETL